MSAVPLSAADKWECVLQRPLSGLFVLVVVVVASVLKIHEIRQKQKKKKIKKKVEVREHAVLNTSHETFSQYHTPQEKKKIKVAVF